MMTVAVLKSANSDSMRKKEYFSDYEMKLVEEFDWPESGQQSQKEKHQVQRQTTMSKREPVMEVNFFCP